MFIEFIGVLIEPVIKEPIFLTAKRGENGDLWPGFVQPWKKYIP